MAPSSRRSTILALAIVTLVSAACSSNNYAPVADLEKPVKRTSGVHVVQAGETLYYIAWRYGRDYRELARANRLSRPYLIKPGQRINLRPSAAGSQKTVKTKRPPATDRSTVKVTRPAATPATRLTWRWPVTGRVIKKFYHRGINNKGIDIRARAGAPVVAAADGVVVYAGNGLIGYGNLVIIKHNDLYLSAYAHNRKILVAEQKKVKAGQKIAEVGNTAGGGAGLHFEIRSGGKPVDPLKYLPKPKS